MGVSKQPQMLQGVRAKQVTEEASLQLTKNLLRIAVYNISYIRGIFPESFFEDKYLPALDVKIKKLIPKDSESQCLLDWMDKGVYDALQHKYLKTLVFALCESDTGPLLEEYIFNFNYDINADGVSIEIGRTGVEGSKCFKSPSKYSLSEMRNSACKMIRTLIQLMRTLDSLPSARTVLMKLHYYDERTPSDYEPPLFRPCLPEENFSWSKIPLKLNVGDVDSYHYAIALKVKSILDSCDKDITDTTSHGTEPTSESEGTMLEDESNKTQVKDSNLSAFENQDEDDTYKKIKSWILTDNKQTLELVNVLTHFPTLSSEAVQESLNLMVKEGHLRLLGKDSYSIIKSLVSTSKNEERMISVDKSKTESIVANETSKQENAEIDELYTKAVFYTLSSDYIGVAKLQKFLGGEIPPERAIEIIGRMTKDGLIENGYSNRRRKVLKTESNAQKLKEVTITMSKYPTEGNVSGTVEEFNGDKFKRSSTSENSTGEVNVLTKRTSEEKGIAGEKTENQILDSQNVLEVSNMSLVPAVASSVTLFNSFSSLNLHSNSTLTLLPSHTSQCKILTPIPNQYLGLQLSKQTISGLENVSDLAIVPVAPMNQSIVVFDSQEITEANHLIRKTSLGLNCIDQRPEKRVRHTE